MKIIELLFFLKIFFCIYCFFMFIGILWCIVYVYVRACIYVIAFYFDCLKRFLQAKPKVHYIFTL